VLTLPERKDFVAIATDNNTTRAINEWPTATSEFHNQAGPE
jgi:hypothetical protein